MAHTSMLRDLVDDPDIQEELLAILDMQMATTSMLAVDSEMMPEGLPLVEEKHVAYLEERIDEMDAALEPLQSFVIPGGHPAISQAHIARTVCRRTERAIHRLQEEVDLDHSMIRFYNRLSDYFFVLSRKIASLNGLKQQPWRRSL